MSDIVDDGTKPKGIRITEECQLDHSGYDWTKSIVDARNQPKVKLFCELYLNKQRNEEEKETD